MKKVLSTENILESCAFEIVVNGLLITEEALSNPNIRENLLWAANREYVRNYDDNGDFFNSDGAKQPVDFVIIHHTIKHHISEEECGDVDLYVDYDDEYGVSARYGIRGIYKK